MASNGSNRGGLLTAGGILSIIGGAFEVIGGGMVVALIVSPGLRHALLPLPPMPWLPGGYEHIIPVIPTWVIIVGVPLLVLGIVAIIGGVSAIRRKSFGLSLAGAICALPSSILGILAVIFVSLAKREFEAEK
jgi:hypothetical protein